MIVARHSGRDAGIQSQGCETVDYRVYKNQTLVQSTNYRPWLWIPASRRNDGVLAKMRIAAIDFIGNLVDSLTIAA